MWPALITLIKMAGMAVLIVAVAQKCGFIDDDTLPDAAANTGKSIGSFGKGTREGSK